LPVTLKPVITAKNSQSNDKKTIKALGIGFHLPDIIESNETNFHSHQRPQNFNDIRKKIKPAPIPIFNIEIPSKIKSVSITLDSRPKNTSNPDYEYKQFNTTSNLSLLAAIKSITEKYRETYRIE
jgi:hypothetical protein